MRRAAITGLGAVTGFGRGVSPLWESLLAGRRALRPAPAALPAGPLALVPELPLSWPARAAELARWAAAEALADAVTEETKEAGLPADSARVGVACGTTLGGIGDWLPWVRAPQPADTPAPCFGYAAPAQAVATLAGARGPLVVPSVACASGNAALAAALDLIRQGRCDLVLAGGADALHDFVVGGFGCLKALDPEPCRPFDRGRRGLNLGEGACFLVVEAEAHARARGARIHAWLEGAGIAADAVHMTGPDREGRGAARAIAAALADADRRGDEIDFVSAHGTATAFNDLMEGKALPLAFGPRVPPVNSIKGALGHTLGAAAALEALVCVRTLQTGLVPPTAGLVEIDPEIPLDVVHTAARPLPAKVVLSTASGFGGTNAAVVLSRADAAERAHPRE